jgi:hypothetical protein
MAVKLIDEEGTRWVKDTELGIPDGDAETSYEIRQISKAKYRSVNKAHTRPVINKRTHRKEDETDLQAASDELLDFALVNWKGITYRGTQVPCTTENKALLDTVRATAILDAAGIGEVEEAPEQRKASFRQPAAVD